MASAPLGAHNGDEVYILEGAETAATPTASSTQVENELEQVGSRKSRSQTGAELELQERQSAFAAPVDRLAGQRAAGKALASCSVGDLQGLGIPAAALG